MRVKRKSQAWLRVLGDQQDEASERQKEKIFYKKIKLSTALRPFVDYNDRIEEAGHTVRDMLLTLKDQVEHKAKM